VFGFADHEGTLHSESWPSLEAWLIDRLQERTVWDQRGAGERNGRPPALVAVLDLAPSKVNLPRWAARCCPMPEEDPLVEMSVSASFRSFVVEQLQRTAPGIRTRSMFGGVGIYAAEIFFALMDDDTVYFKVDETTRVEFEARGMGPFRPYGEHGEVMQYYQVPAELLEDAEELRPWVTAAIGVARRAKRRRPRRGGGL
jgi:DNA transformation protein and related proteins